MVNFRRGRGARLVALTATVFSIGGSFAANADDTPPVVELVPITIDGDRSDWPSETNGIPGTATFGEGAWTFTDYVYDDKGTGAFTYPLPAETGANSADIAVLHVKPGPEAVQYLVELNTLIVEDSTVIALAVDTDHNESTGGGEWPLNAKLSSPGWEHVVTVWGSGGVVNLSDGRSFPVPVATSVENNLIEFEVPYSVADPGHGTWRYRGASGVWDRAAGTWAEVQPADSTATATDRVSPSTTPRGKSSASHPNAFNLLFRNVGWDGGTDATDETSSGDFQSAKQAAALASGDITAFARDVDFGALIDGQQGEPPQPTGDAQFTRIYASAAFPNALPEGVSRGENAPTGSIYNGRYQPYIVFVPATYWDRLPGPAPMFPLLHGWMGNHRGFNPSDNSFWNEVVRAHGAVVAKTLGRGQEVWYEHLGELDTLEVIADVQRRYTIDSDRIYLGGTSMGGLGTIKVASQHPDLFAGVFPSVPPMGDRAQGYALPQNNDWDLVHVTDSFRNLPVRNFTGTYDPLVPAGVDSERFCDRLAALTYDHDCWRDISSGGTHRGFENDRARQIEQLLSEHRRVVDPARVTYASHPVFRRQAAAVGIDHLLRYDRAYWLSGISYPAPPDDAGCHVAQCVSSPGVPNYPVDPGVARRLALGEEISLIDVRSWGTGAGDPVATPIEDDPSPTLIRRGLVLEAGPTVTARNAFDLRAENVNGFDLDLARMGLTLGAPLTARVSGNGPLNLGLIGPSGACAATLNGSAVEAERAGDRVVLELTLTATAAELVVTCA